MASSKKRTSKKAVAAGKPAPKAARPRGAAPRKDSSGFPDRIFAVASPHSLGGVSMFAQGLSIDASNVYAFESDEELVRRSIARLQNAGFEVVFTPVVPGDVPFFCQPHCGFNMNGVIHVTP